MRKVKKDILLVNSCSYSQ